MSAPCLQCGIDNDLHIFDDDDPAAHEPWTARQEIERLRKRLDDTRAVLVYARDCLDHTAKFSGIDWTLLRKVIGKVLGEPAPEVGSTFAQVMAIDHGDEH